MLYVQMCVLGWVVESPVVQRVGCGLCVVYGSFIEHYTSQSLSGRVTYWSAVLVGSVLYLHYNQLSGTIPSTISSLTGLTYVRLCLASAPWK